MSTILIFFILEFGKFQNKIKLDFEIFIKLILNSTGHNSDFMYILIGLPTSFFISFLSYKYLEPILIPKKVK